MDDETKSAQDLQTISDTDSGQASFSEDRILDQKEIDSLLAVGHGSDQDLRGWRLLTDSSKISYERLPMLEIVIDRLLRYLSTSLRNFTAENVELSLENMTSIRFGDYLNAVSLPTLIGVFKIEEWDTMGLMTLDASLIYSIVDVLLGGRQSTRSQKIDSRPFTAIECNLVERLMKIILSDFSKSFEPIASIHFRFERLETNPRFAAIVRPVNASVLTRLQVGMEGRGGIVELLLPYASLEPVREQLLQMFMGEKFGQDTVWETHFGAEVWEATVAIEAILDDVSLSLNDVLGWKPGSQVFLKARSDSTIRMVCGDTPIFTGKMGQKNGNISVKVERNYLQERKSL